MRNLKTLLLITIVLTAGGPAVATQIERNVPPEATPSSLSAMQGGGLTLSEAVERVRRQYNGRIVSAETKCNGNRETHVIKVLTQDGKVKTVRVPGKGCG